MLATRRNGIEQSRHARRSPESVANRTAFEDEVLDRLFLLNELRAHEEQALGRGAKGKPAKRSKPRTPRGPTPDRPKTKKAKKANAPSDDAQGSLDIE